MTHGVPRIARAADDMNGWVALRQALWPEDGAAAHRAAADELARSDGHLALLAHAEGGEAVGLAEAAVRRDWVNGCDRPPVLFLEGLYVAPGHRRRGLARALVAEVADWGRARGLGEFASDTPLDEVGSHDMHRALGFAETERVVFFHRSLETRS